LLGLAGIAAALLLLALRDIHGIATVLGATLGLLLAAGKSRARHD